MTRGTGDRTPSEETFCFFKICRIICAHSPVICCTSLGLGGLFIASVGNRAKVKDVFEIHGD